MKFLDPESGNWNGRICIFQLGKEILSYNLEPKYKPYKKIVRWEINVKERKVVRK